MELANDVAAYKQAHGLPVLRPEREQEILEWAAEQSGPEFREFAVRLFGEVMRLSREYQDFLLKEWKKKETSE
ncbi:MAG: chorismate mutase [Lachnospiraceae bacterium]|nr:chorismate mutase [Lachnospiraceae bacterium]